VNQSVNTVVIGVSLFLFLFAALTPLNASYDLMFALFMIGQFLVPYMVYVVLRHGTESKKEFSSNFYEDVAGKSYQIDLEAPDQ